MSLRRAGAWRAPLRHTLLAGTVASLLAGFGTRAIAGTGTSASSDAANATNAGNAAYAANAAALPHDPAKRPLPLASLRSGITFAGADVRALQEDEPANPAQLWIEQGRTLWDAPAGDSARSCRSCHGDVRSMRGVSTRYPRLDTGNRRLLDLEDRIRQCRSQRQGAPAPAFESDELLALTLLVTQASRGLPLRTPVDAALLPHWRAGAESFHRRQGQLNLSCAQCHDSNWGRRLYADTLSQGQPNGYPIYRLEWQKPGSLERRLRSCQASIRAELPEWGAQSQRALALYLKWRAEGLPVEVPAVRK